MAVRYKILALASALILLFAIAIGISTLMAGHIKGQIAAILTYHIPLSRMLAEFDLQSYRYEMTINRMMNDRTPNHEAIATVEARSQDIMVTAQTTVMRIDELLERGLDDDNNTIADRVAMAKVKGILGTVIRDLVPYGEVGTQAIAAYRSGGADAGVPILEGLDRYDNSMTRDTATMTASLTQLSIGAVETMLREQRRALSLHFALFIATAAVGVSMAAVLARRIAGSMRQLIAGAQAVEAGDLTVSLPDRGRDEIALLARSFNRMVGELRSRERIKDTFGKFVDPRVVARLIDAGADAPSAAERRVATVFFSDIKGFSGLSETLTPAALVNLLNSYFTRMTDVVRARNGVVDKYIGDAVMAFWATPFTPDDAHGPEAVLAALQQQAAMAEFRRELPQILGLRRNVPEFKIRVGIATGEVVLGTIGSATVKSFTAIGDTVNIASRIEGANKVYDTSILVTEETWRLASGHVDGREIDRIIVAGKSEPVGIYEPLAPAGHLSPEQQRLVEHFGEGLAAYRAGDWMLAKSKFRAALDAVPDDGPSKLFLVRIERFDGQTPDDWDGIWRLTEK